MASLFVHCRHAINNEREKAPELEKLAGAHARLHVRHVHLTPWHHKNRAKENSRAAMAEKAARFTLFVFF